jgi:hypothetical protein
VISPWLKCWKSKKSHVIAEFVILDVVEYIRKANLNALSVKMNIR